MPGTNHRGEFNVKMQCLHGSAFQHDSYPVPSPSTLPTYEYNKDYNSYLLPDPTESVSKVSYQCAGCISLKDNTDNMTIKTTSIITCLETSKSPNAVYYTD